MTFKITPASFINAEPAILGMQPKNDSNSPVVPVPAVVLSFGEEDGPIEDRAITTHDAQQMVLDIIQSLAHMGDPVAQAIIANFFTQRSPKDQEYQDEQQDYPEYDDGYGGCTDCGG